MNYKNLLVASSLSLLLFSCDNGGAPDGYEKAESGVFYKFHTQNTEGVKPKEGDIVQLVMRYKTNNDSLIFDSKEVSRDGSGAIEFPLGPSTFKGSFEDAVTMMSIGDSASFLISADSIYLKTFRAQALPSYIPAGSMLTFEAKLVNVKTKEVAMKEAEEKKQAQMQMMAQRREIEPQEIAKYVADNKITVKPTESGLYFIETKKGSGAKVEKGKTVEVNYTGKFLDGRVFDSSEGKPEPFKFQVGAGGIIPGWEEAMLMMSAGSKASILLPSSIAYGEAGIGEGLIPPYTPLVFDVEIVSVN